MSLCTISLGMSEVGTGPCQVREEGKCPYQNSKLPSCNNCSFAQKDHEVFQGVHGGETYNYSSMGTKSTVGEVRSEEYFDLTHNGDERDPGRVSISKHVRSI